MISVNARTAVTTYETVLTNKTVKFTKTRLAEGFKALG